MANLIFKIFIVSLFTSCYFSEECSETDCSFQSRPSYCKTESSISHGSVQFMVKTDSLNQKVNIKIYRGNIEDDFLVDSLMLDNDDGYQSIPLGDFSVVAIYKGLEKDVVVIKSLDMEAETESSDCCYTCYKKPIEKLDMHPVEEAK
jgi:hypothetical protein